MIVGVTAVTFIASDAIIKKANENADYAFVQAMSARQTDGTSAINPSDCACTQTNPSETTVPQPTESSGGVQQYDGQYYVDSRTVVPDDNGETATCPDGSIIHIGAPVEINGVLYYPISFEDYSRLCPTGDNYEVSSITPDRIYLVQKGDTLSKISGMVSFSVDELAEYNHIKNVDLIYEGEALRIPDER